MNALNLSMRERYIFIAAFIVILSALACNFIIGPFFKKWKEIDNEIVIAKARLTEGRRLLRNKNAIIKEYALYAASAKEISGLLGYIQRQSESFGIKATDIRSMPAVKKKLYREYLVELQIEGRFTDVNRLVSQLVKSPIFITVKKFRFRTMAGTSSHLKGTLILSKIAI